VPGSRPQATGILDGSQRVGNWRRRPVRAPSGGGDGSGIGDSTYTVQANETLMLIAFKLYGDYSKWKEIASLNQVINKIKSHTESMLNIQTEDNNTVIVNIQKNMHAEIMKSF
jgi:nucleoid-associated protein YgaU